MRPKRFSIGQKVGVNRRERKWSFGPPHPILKLSEVYTVNYYEWINNMWYIGLEEVPQDMGFAENLFSPIITDTELEEALKEVQEPIDGRHLFVEVSDVLDSLPPLPLSLFGEFVQGKKQFVI